MTKILKTILVLFGALMPLCAVADELDWTLAKGDASEWQLSVSLDGSAQYSAFQMDVVLPDGAVFADGSITPSSRLATGTTLQAVNHPNGFVRVTFYTSSNANAIKAGTGEIFTLQLTASTALLLDDFRLKNALFTNTSLVESTLYLKEKGDVCPEQKQLNQTLQTLVNEANSYIEQKNYPTLNGWTELNNTLTECANALAISAATQSLIDTLTDTLSAYKQAVEAYEKEQAEKEAAYQQLVARLQQAMQEANDYVSANNYPSLPAYSTLQQSLKDAQTAIEEHAATEHAITDLTDALSAYKQAVEAYEKEQAEKEAAYQQLVARLQQAMQEANEYLSANGYPSLPAYSTLQQSLKDAQTAIEEHAATEQTITDLTDNLSAYKQAVAQYLAEEEAKREAQRLLNEALQEQVNRADSLAEDELYSVIEASVSAPFDEALQTAKNELQQEVATQATIDTLREAADALEQAINTERERRTSVQIVAADGAKHDVFDLAGRRISRGALQRGIYVKNGHKVLR